MAEVRPIYLVGANGFLGRYLQRALTGYRVSIWPTASLLKAMPDGEPGIILNASGLSQADACLKNPGLATELNIELPRKMATLSSRGWRTIHLSTDCVFGGQSAPYQSHSPALPVSFYGETKLRGEDGFFARGGDLVVRLSLLVGPSLNSGRRGFFDHWMEKLRSGQSIEAFTDEYRSATLYSVAAECLVHLAFSEASGLLLLGGSERLSRYDIGLRLARALKAPVELVKPTSRVLHQGAEARPEDLTMRCSATEKWLPSSLRTRLCAITETILALPSS